MGKKLIIVESPTKTKTLKKFLGPEYLLESSVGHIRDLPEKEFGIDIENKFEPHYETMADKKGVIEKLRKAAKEVDIVYLFSDPDREGEAIAWHITQILPKGTKFKRVASNSMTKDAVLDALAHPRELDDALVNAQQARRLLDRIVGYKISPILNRRIQRGQNKGVSAGRVQSVALKLVVDREKEIEAFKSIEYWNIGALFRTDDTVFSSYLYAVDHKRVEKEAVPGKEVTLIGDKTTAENIVQRVKRGPYQVGPVDRKEKRRFPVPPFITSTLQQEASRHFGYNAAKTMSIAQSLYEGVDLGSQGTEGLITYMRTDSVRVAPEVVTQARAMIKSEFGPEYLPDEPKNYSTKKSAQDAHEAIRPANLDHRPEHVEQYLSREQSNLYSLIWKRFFASQMNPAIYDTVAADISADQGNVTLRATGSVMKFSGFLAIYEEKVDDAESETDKMLPPLVEGQILSLEKVTHEQAFTKPPPRYTEASLVKELEKSGIGRPSTYAAIMNKIQSRDYTVKDQKRLKPTELGCVLAAFLETNFAQIMRIDFTARMEDELEDIAENRKDWRQLLEEFWIAFSSTLEIAQKEAFIPRVETDLDCPDCGAKLQKIWYKNKYFYGCSKYPDCKYSAPIEQFHFNKEEYADGFDFEQPCPICASLMKIRHGRYGAFLGCTRYPECKGIVNIPKKGEATPLSAEDMPKCPAIGCDGHLNARKSRFGKTFYSCSNYPDCDVIVNDLDDLEEKYQDHPKTPYVKKPRRGFRTGAATKGKAKDETEAETKPKKKTSTAKKPAAKTKTKAKTTTTKAKTTKTAAAKKTKAKKPDGE